MLVPTRGVSRTPGHVRTLMSLCQGFPHPFELFSAQEFIEHFVEKNSCVLSRSVIQILYEGVWAGQSMLEVLQESARSFICPPVLIPKAPIMNSSEVCISPCPFLKACPF